MVPTWCGIPIYAAASRIYGLRPALQEGQAIFLVLEFSAVIQTLRLFIVSHFYRSDNCHALNEVVRIRKCLRGDTVFLAKDLQFFHSEFKILGQTVGKLCQLQLVLLTDQPMYTFYISINAWTISNPTNPAWHKVIKVRDQHEATFGSRGVPCNIRNSLGRRGIHWRMRGVHCNLMNVHLGHVQLCRFHFYLIIAVMDIGILELILMEAPQAGKIHGRSSELINSWKQGSNQRKCLRRKIVSSFPPVGITVGSYSVMGQDALFGFVQEILGKTADFILLL